MPVGSALKLILHVGHDRFPPPHHAADAAQVAQLLPPGRRRRVLILDADVWRGAVRSIVESRRLAEAAVSLQMDAVLLSAPSKYIAPTMEIQAEAVVDTLSHCADIPGFYYHYPEVYYDNFELLPLLRTVAALAKQRVRLPRAHLCPRR